jgi:signal transduction histidine kinase/DNA-binding response OmpR family regulator
MNNYKTRCILIYLTFLCLTRVFSQDADSLMEAQLWSQIEDDFLTRDTKDSYGFIIDRVYAKCREDKSCLVNMTYKIMAKLEHDRFDLRSAIYVGEQGVQFARQAGNHYVEGMFYRSVARYYDAMGIPRLGTISLDSSLAIFERIGNQENIISAKRYKVETQLGQGRDSLVMQEIEDLFDEAQKLELHGLAKNICARLIGLSLEYRSIDEVERYLNILERYPHSEPLNQTDYGYWRTIENGRATVRLAKGDTLDAVRHYEQAMYLAESDPDHWQAISIRRNLSDLYWAIGEKNKSKKYIEIALEKALKFNIDDLLPHIFISKSIIAESEGRLADALHDFKNYHELYIDYQLRSEGFDAQRHYLQIERDQLATESRNKELDLKLKRTQLILAIAGVVFIFLFALGLIFLLFKQRKAKRVLAKQNLLIESQKEQLKKLDLVKSQFFTNISHELRTPLSLILGPVDLLLNEKHSMERQNELLNIIDTNGKQLDSLVNEILELRKLEIGNVKLDVEPTLVALLFKGYCAQFDSFAEQKQINYSFETDVVDNLIANIDRKKCRQIIYNLLSNALKFTRPGERIQARMQIENGELRFSVQDTGQGIHKSDLPNLFDRFYQAHHGDKAIEGGTGIGLALCSKYAKLFQGEIHVESQLGMGSTFTISFPVEWSDKAADVENPPLRNLSYDFDMIAAPESTRINDSNKERKLTLMVVEDNRSLQQYLGILLADMYHVIFAENGREALDTLTEMTKRKLDLPAMIISDLMMPVMNGYELLNELKSNDHAWQIPFVMLTANSDLTNKLDALRVGVDDYLMKPFENDELLVRIKNLLDNSKHRVNIEDAGDSSDDQIHMPAAADQDWLKDIESYLEQNIHQDWLSVPVIASHLAMSESTLLRQLKRLTGLTPAKYLLEMRLIKAHKLLEVGACHSISQVATRVGIRDAGTLTKNFKKRFGKLPSDFVGTRSTSV